ncbi:CBS domain-containing protein [Heliorestis convoluta]|uniref:CBS domain-containing protein n=1 Tax=Heliorestis convoluta TaxID=356322 RepID=A0A5Q2N464_9FIRM|nr:CBS domain-containing protein [Heliorestis convoluta]QGG49111.1 CBS domain-containing protein [Heliorestis convoluta]
MSPQTIKASQIMTREVYSVYGDSPINEVAKLLTEKKISGVPVISSKGEVIGIVSEGDLLYKDREVKYPSYIALLGGLVYLESPKRFEEEFRKMIALRAEEIMTQDVITVEEDTLVTDMAAIMTEQRINRLPVVRQGKLVGIVTRADIIKALSEESL